MITVIEPIWKSKETITFAWAPEPGDVQAYNIYVGRVAVAGSMTKIASNLYTGVSTNPEALGKVSYDVPVATVRAALSWSADTNFLNMLPIYFTLTTVDSVGSESAKGTIIEVTPVGIMGKYRREDPTINRNIFGFSDEEQKWVKAASSGNGALITDPSDFYKANITTEYTWDGTNLASTRSYLSDMTVSGSNAKLTTYTYSGSVLTKVVVVDSTVL